MMRKKHIIFDFDGTIADTIPLMRTIAQNMADEAQSGIKITEEDWEWVRNHKLIDLPKKFGIPFYKVPGLLLQGRAKFKKLIFSVFPCRDMAEALHTLKANGYSCAILSSTSRETIQEFLLQHRLVDLFDFVHSELNLFGKDTALQSLIKQYNLKKDDVVYVGDEIRDLEACQKINLDCVSVTWGLSSRAAHAAHGAKHIVDTPQELLDMLKKLKAKS